jgi:hypothetical protein
MVGVCSRFAIGGGEYIRLIYPNLFPVYIEWCREDGCVLILWVCLVELVRDEPVIYASTELFCCEGVLPSFVNMVNGVVEEVSVAVNSCDVEWRGCGMLG